MPDSSNDILISRDEIAIQEKVHNNHALEVVVPLHPSIFSLDELARMDRSIPEHIITSDELISEYEADVNAYINALADFPDNHALRVTARQYARFNPDWEFYFRQSQNDYFVDLIWREHGAGRGMGYSIAPRNIFNYKTRTGTWFTPQEITKEFPKVQQYAIYWPQKTIVDQNLVLFQPNKFEAYNGKEGGVKYNGNRCNTLVRVFSSTYLFNIPQGLLLRDFAVRYLNELLKRAMQDME